MPSALCLLAAICRLQTRGGPKSSRRPTCACGVDFLYRYLAPRTGSRSTVQHPEARPQDLVPLVHLQKLEGASTPVTLHLGSLHKRVPQVPRQPQVLGAAPSLAVTPSGVEALTLKGSPGQQLPGADERAREQAGGHMASRTPTGHELSGGLGTARAFLGVGAEAQEGRHVDKATARKQVLWAGL